MSSDPSVPGAQQRRVRVTLERTAYDVVIAPGLCARAGELVRATFPDATRCAVLVDPGVPAGVGASLRDSVRNAGLEAIELRVPDGHPSGEAGKSMDLALALCEQMARADMDRAGVVLSCAGGLLGDVAGFAASIYRRGVSWVHAPSTLLAMVDAGVGGKTGVNLRSPAGLLKNMAGTFHQPSLVLVDPRLLDSLSLRERRAGLAECIKHGMLRDSVAGLSGAEVALLTQGALERAIDAVLSPEPARAGLEAFLAAQVALKARVVERDERETASDDAGGRALLNLGHTFAHVLEGLPRCSLLHGEAVALGLLGACTTSQHLGLLDVAGAACVRGLIERAGLPTSIAGLPHSDELVVRMRSDKKTLAGSLRLVLPVGSGGLPGRARVVRAPDLAGVRAGWDGIGAPGAQ